MVRGARRVIFPLFRKGEPLVGTSVDNTAQAPPSDAVDVSLLRDEDAPAIAAHYREVFGDGLAEGRCRRFDWQYRENPHQQGSPEIWVARQHGNVLGQYASMPVRLAWGGREVRSSWGMDVFLREEARGLGLGARLFTAWSDHVEVALGLGLTPSSYGLFQKLRYQDVGPVPFFVKVLDPFAVARRRLGALLALPGGLALSVGLALRGNRLRPAADVTVTAAGTPGPEWDALWEARRGDYAMCVRRDAAYLDWKYRRAPHVRYDLQEARRGGVLVGFAVTRVGEHQGTRLGWLIDLFAGADTGVIDALLAHTLAQFRAAQVVRAQAFAMYQPVQGALRRAGFLAQPSPMQFCVRARVPSDAVFADRGRWQVMFGDSDMDR